MFTRVRQVLVFFALATCLAIPADAQVAGPQWQISGSVVGPVGKVNCTSGGCSFSGTTYTIAGGSPSGAAGGDLGGTYPNPGVLKITAATGTLASASGTDLVLDGVGIGHGINLKANGSVLVDLGVTLANYVVLSGGTSFAALAGAGNFSLNAMTGGTDMPTGNFNWNGASNKTVSFVSAGSGQVIMTSAGNALYSATGSSNLLVDAGGEVLIGTLTTGAATVGKAGIRNSQLGMLNQTVGSVLTVSSNAIAPTTNIHHVGAGLIKTITVPSTITAGAVLQIIPDAAFTYDATGNIVVPGGGGTATINRLMTFVWDGAKWTPSY